MNQERSRSAVAGALALLLGLAVSPAPASAQDAVPPFAFGQEPTGTILDPAPILRVRIGDSASGVDADSISMSVNGLPLDLAASGAPSLILAVADAPMLGEGTHEVELSVSDLAGNALNGYRWHFVVDANQPPAVSFIEPDGAGDMADRWFPVRYSVFDPDPGDRVEVAFSYGLHADGTGRQPIALHPASGGGAAVELRWNCADVPEGDYYIFADAVDRAGESSFSRSSGRVQVRHAPTGGSVEVHFVNIIVANPSGCGQVYGDAVLYRSPGGRWALIDAGNDTQGAARLVPYLQSLGVNHLEFAIVTHYDSDHCGGFSALHAAGITIGTLYDRGGDDGPICELNRYSRSAIQIGQTLDLDGMIFRCIWRGLAGRQSNDNGQSIAMKISYHELDIYQAGDCEGDCLTACGSSTALQDIEVYQANHHAGPNANPTTLLYQLGFQTVVIQSMNYSCSGQECDGIHPNSTIRQRYAAVLGGDAPRDGYWHTRYQGNIVLRYTCGSDTYTVEGDGVGGPDLECAAPAGPFTFSLDPKPADVPCTPVGDREAPVLSAASPVGSPSEKPASASFRLTDADSGVDPEDVVVLLDGAIATGTQFTGSRNDWQVSIDAGGLDPGRSYVVKVDAADREANCMTTESWRFTVPDPNASPPMLSLH